MDLQGPLARSRAMHLTKAPRPNFGRNPLLDQRQFKPSEIQPPAHAETLLSTTGLYSLKIIKETETKEENPSLKKTNPEIDNLIYNHFKSRCLNNNEEHNQHPLGQ